MKSILNRVAATVALLASVTGLLVVATATPAAASYTNNVIVKQAQNKSDPTSWLIIEGRRYWIPSAAVYHCLRDRGMAGPVYLSNGDLDARPDQWGEHARCGTSNNPKGNYDQAFGKPGQVRVRGWSFDPNVYGHEVTIHAYVGGHAGSGARGYNLGKANVHRPDVDRAFPGVGAHHGFDKSFGTHLRGPQPVCVYALNLGPGSNVFLGCKTVNITNPDPSGNFDQAWGLDTGGTKVRVRGWAVDPNYLAQPVTIHAYVGGYAGQAGAIGYNLGTTGVYRPDVNKVFPGYGNNQGFDVIFTAAKIGFQPVCLYALNRGPGNTKFLGCKTVNIGVNMWALGPPYPSGSLGLPVKDTVCRVGPGQISGYPNDEVYSHYVFREMRILHDNTVACSWWAITQGEADAYVPAGAWVAQLKVLAPQTACGWLTGEAPVIVGGTLRCLWTKNRGPADGLDGRYV